MFKSFFFLYVDINMKNHILFINKMYTIIFPNIAIKQLTAYYNGIQNNLIIILNSVWSFFENEYVTPKKNTNNKFYNIKTLSFRFCCFTVYQNITYTCGNFNQIISLIYFIWYAFWSEKLCLRTSEYILNWIEALYFNITYRKKTAFY